MNSEDCRNSIPDHEILIRAIREKYVDRQTGAIKKAAFLPRRSSNGKDDDGLSVSKALSETTAQILQRVPSQDGLFCSLTAAAVRGICVEDTFLEVCPDATPEDDHHSLIKNVPTIEATWRTLTERFAELLAKAAERYGR